MMNQLPRQFTQQNIPHVQSHSPNVQSHSHHDQQIKRSISQPMKLKQAHEESRFNMTQASAKKFNSHNEYVDTFNSPVQEISDQQIINFQQRMNSNPQRFMPIQEQLLNEEVGIANSIQEDFTRMYQNTIQDLQMKITLLITENERLIHINEGLMRENSTLKTTKQSPQVAQITQANDQLRQMIQQLDQQYNQHVHDSEQKISLLLRENERLNVIVLERINEIEVIRQDHSSSRDNLSTYEEERVLLQEKITTLERQKVLLEQQLVTQDKSAHVEQQLNDSQQEIQKLQYYTQQLQNELQNQSVCLTNIYHNHEVQTQELHANYNRALQDQQQQTQQNYKQKMEKVMVQISQELGGATQRENNLIEQIHQKQDEWHIERQRMQELISRLQQQKQEDKKLIEQVAPKLITITDENKIPQQTQVTFREPSAFREPNAFREPSAFKEPSIIKEIFKETIYSIQPTTHAKVDNENIVVRRDETIQPQQDRSLQVLQLNTFRRSAKSQYDPSVNNFNNTDYYTKYARREEQYQLDTSDKSQTFQQNNRLNVEAQENCRQILSGAMRQ